MLCPRVCSKLLNKVPAGISSCKRPHVVQVAGWKGFARIGCKPFDDFGFPAFEVLPLKISWPCANKAGSARC